VLQTVADNHLSTAESKIINDSNNDAAMQMTLMAQKNKLLEAMMDLIKQGANNIVKAVSQS
jgi:hypothetical protein